jgi:Zn-dependent protease
MSQLCRTSRKRAGLLIARSPGMNLKHLSASERLLVAGMACSTLVLTAGVIAMVNRLGIAVASGLLTVAAVVGAAGYAFAKNQPWNIGHWVLIAAGLPLFFGLYAVGLAILRSLGQVTAGGLLVAIAAVLATATGLIALKWRKPGLRVRHR